LNDAVAQVGGQAHQSHERGSGTPSAPTGNVRRVEDGQERLWLCPQASTHLKMRLRPASLPQTPLPRPRHHQRHRPEHLCGDGGAEDKASGDDLVAEMSDSVPASYTIIVGMLMTS